MHQPTDLRRAGFSRRFWALAVDIFVVAALFQVVAIPAYLLSNGYIQSSGIIRSTSCASLPALPSGINVPTDFNPTFASECRTGLFGLETGHSAVVGRQSREGNVTSTVSAGFMLDRQGRPIAGLSLDLFIIVVLLVMRWWLDCRTGSVGRRLLGIEFADPVAPGSPAPPPALIGRRYLLFALPLVPAWLLGLSGGLFPSFAFVNWFFWPVIAAGVIVLIGAIAATVSIVRGRDAFYDRLAGTAVVCLKD